MRIDSHQHFWKLDHGNYHWLNPSPSILYRDYLPEDLQPQLQNLQIDRTIVVQAAPTKSETASLIDLAKRCDSIAGVVGWLDLESESFADELEYWRAQKKFVGVRPMLQDLEDDAWIRRPRVLRSLELMAQFRVPLDLLTYTRHLP